ncbi:MAG: WecB/TagA/CpsF family glycosyltransferase, partial [Dehalococcoidia bacterium]
LGTARRDPGFAQVVRDAGLVVADGMPVRWLSLIQHSRAGERITGHDLLHACADLAVRRGYTVGFLGSAPGVAECAVDVLAARHPGLKVAGIFRGDFHSDGTPVDLAAADAMIASIRQARPDMLFVALGCPKQEMWSARHQRLAGVPVTVGIGGVLDVLAGRFKRAPHWVQRAGMEWAYRLSQDPKRLWKRYLLQDIPTLTLSALDAARSRYFPQGTEAQ